MVWSIVGAFFILSSPFFMGFSRHYSIKKIPPALTQEGLYIFILVISS